MNLTKLKQLVATSTPAPWRWEVHGCDLLMSHDRVILSGDLEVNQSDASVIAELRNTIDDLLEEIDAGRELNRLLCQRVEAEIERAPNSDIVRYLAGLVDQYERVAYRHLTAR